MPWCVFVQLKQEKKVGCNAREIICRLTQATRTHINIHSVLAATTLVLALEIHNIRLNDFPSTSLVIFGAFTILD